MRKLINILCLLLIFTDLVSSQAVDTYFKQGNKAYSEGNYQNAVDDYLKVIAGGVESGEVFFNLGNAYYKLNQIGRSILYYEKARQFLEGDKALEQNLKLARLRIVDKIEPIPKLFLEEWWIWGIHIFSIPAVAWICFILFLVAMFSLAFYFIFSKRMLKRLTWITSILFVIALSFYLSRIYQFESSDYGIILVSKVSVVSEPSLTGDEVFIIHEGTKVKINREIDGWLEISLADGKTGWLKSNSLAWI
jgi:tetratricopeptide (TPR) repeat protein